MKIGSPLRNRSIVSNTKNVNKRLKKRVNFNPRIVKILKKLQLPIEIKKKKSNFIIKNNFKNKSVKKNVKKVLKIIFENA